MTENLTAAYLHGNAFQRFYGAFFGFEGTFTLARLVDFG